MDWPQAFVFSSVAAVLITLVVFWYKMHRRVREDETIDAAIVAATALAVQDLREWFDLTK